MGRKRMTMPKKKEDIEKIVEEVESHHEHHHEHHHHGAPDLDIALRVIEDLIDSLSARYTVIEARVERQGIALGVLYRVVAYLVDALNAKDEDDRRDAMEKALRELKRLSDL